MAAGPLTGASAPAGDGSGGLTFDQALTQYVGEFGKGQITNFWLASLVWIPNAMLVLLLVFSVGSPVKDHEWACVDQADAACADVFSRLDPSKGFCGMERSQWQWTHPSKTLTAQFDLVCAGAVLVRLLVGA